MISFILKIILNIFRNRRWKYNERRRRRRIVFGANGIGSWNWPTKSRCIKKANWYAMFLSPFHSFF